MQYMLLIYESEANLGKMSAQERGATTLILDDELSASQAKVIEEAVKVKVIDRTALIIDIFARRAKTREGRLQVELAQHEYLLPRLAGQWSHLERLGGGIGTRGPGETQIETDRQLVEKRIHRLKRELEEVREHRWRYRERRKEQGLPAVSLIGYTNAGKSTLFNRLTKAGALAEDKLFATLDPVTRRTMLPSGAFCLVSDTVGFINKLPSGLVAAFRATLEELEDAQLLVHVVDASHPSAPEQERVVMETLKEMKLEERAMLLALNKMDKLMPEVRSEAEFKVAAAERLEKLGPPDAPTVLISAEKGWGTTELRQAIEVELGKSAARKVVAVS